MTQERWDERYRETPLLWSTEPNRFVASELADVEPGTALDLACGEGRNAIWLAERGWEVTGADFSAVAIERARRISRDRNFAVQWICADVTSWEPAGVFDLVLIAYLHLPTGEREAVVRRAAAWLRPEGLLLLVGHDRETAGVSGPDDPDLLWDPRSAAAALAPLEVVSAGSKRRELESGEVAVDTVALARRTPASG